uniref:Ig-like domain-containing protein n=1 Tax=Lynx canadensis TaxID=61383 RepID=A0A667GEI1_LYNCA
MLLWLPLHCELSVYEKQSNEWIVFSSQDWLYSGFLQIVEKRGILKHNNAGTALLSLTFSFCTGLSRGENVEQSPSTLSVQEGNSCVITCSYSDSASNYFPWYKQELGKGPQLIIDIRSSVAKKEDQRLTVLLNKTAKHLSLHIAAAQPADSAVYFCAASAHCVPDTCCLHPNL